jgi:hypothetical protein
MCKRVVNTDISEDITLPDYYPEIRRVLSVRENMMPPAKFISGNKVDVSGVVDYNLVYVSSEGKLASAPLSAEYSFSLPLENISDFEISEGITVLAHSVAESSSVRVSAPRKLQVRSRIRSAVSAWGKMSCAEDIEGLIDPSSIERLTAETLCADIICESSDVVSIETEQKLPSENCRIALADAAVVVNGIARDGEIAKISGDVILKMLVLCEEEDLRESLIRKLPFEAETDLDGMNGECGLRATGNVSEVEISVEEGVASVRVDIILEMCAVANRSVNYVRDIYSLAQESKQESRIYEMPILRDNKNFNFSQSERLELSELNFPLGAEIVDVFASAYIDNIEFEEGKYIMSGNCRYSLICFVDGEYSNCDVRVPFRYESVGEGDISCFDSALTVSGCRAKNDGEFLNIDSEIFASCGIIGSSSAEMISKVEFGEGIENESGVWTVCYLENGENTWDIAKRYRIRATDIKGDPASDRYVIIEK